jgi:hypothetical protein
MNNIQKRFLLFLIGCIGIRSFFVYIAKNINNNYLPFLGLLALLPTFGFIYIYFTNSRQTGLEVFGSKIWWNHLRPIHATLYLLFSLSAFYKKTYSYLFLLADVIIGLFSFLFFHYINNNFKYLF